MVGKPATVGGKGVRGHGSQEVMGEMGVPHDVVGIAILP